MYTEEHYLLARNLLIKPRRASWVTHVSRRDNILILESERHKEQLVLNEVATSIWELCDGNTPVEKILSEFMKIYEHEDDAKRDITTMVLALQGQGLLYLGNEDDAIR